MPSQKKYLSWVDIVAMPRYQTPDTGLSPNKYAGNPPKKSCSCEKCHFEFEEREVFPYLPQEISAHLQQEHQVLKQNNYPSQEVLEHGKQELNYFRQYLPTHLLQKIESDHHQIEQKYFAKGPFQQASACGCNSAQQIPKNLNTNSSCAPPLPKKMPLQTCCHSCHCNPCCCHPQEMRKKSSCSHSCQPCCCHSCQPCHSSCCQHPQQINSCSEDSPLPSVPSPSPIPTTTPYTPPQGPGLPFGGPSEIPTEETEEETVSEIKYRTLRGAFQALVEEMDTIWDLNVELLREIVDAPSTKFIVYGTPEAEGITIRNAVDKGMTGLITTFVEGKYEFAFYLSPEDATKIKEGKFSKEAYSTALAGNDYALYEKYGHGRVYYKMLDISAHFGVPYLMKALATSNCATCGDDFGLGQMGGDRGQRYAVRDLTNATFLKLILATGFKFVPETIGSIKNNTFWEDKVRKYYQDGFDDILKDVQKYPGGQICGEILGLILPTERLSQPVPPRLVSSPIYNFQTKPQNLEIFSQKNLNFSTKQLQYGEIRYQQTTPYEFGLKKELENNLKLNELFSLLESWGLKITTNQKLNEARRKIPLRFGIFGQESAFFISQKYYVPVLTNKNEVSSEYGGMLEGMTITPKMTLFAYRSEKKEKRETSPESLEGLRKFYKLDPLLSEKEIEKKLENFKFSEKSLPYTDRELKNIIKKYPRELSETVFEYNFANRVFTNWIEIPNKEYEYYKFSDNLKYDSDVRYLVLGMKIYLKNFTGIVLEEKTINYLLQGNFTTLSNEFNMTNLEDLASKCASHNQLGNTYFRELNGKNIYIPCLINIPKPEIMIFIHELIHYFHGITYLWKKTGTEDVEISEINYKDDEEKFTYLISSIIRLKGLLKMNSSLLLSLNNNITGSNIPELILNWSQCLNYFSSLLLEYQQNYPEWINFARELGVID